MARYLYYTIIQCNNDDELQNIDSLQYPYSEKNGKATIWGELARHLLLNHLATDKHGKGVTGYPYNINKRGVSQEVTCR